MKFALDNGDAAYRIQAYHAGRHIMVNHRNYPNNLLITPDWLQTWEVPDFEQLQAGHFEALLEFKPDCVLFGSGTKQRFPSSVIFADLYKAGIGVEVMDSGAACRTYTVLMSEGRRVGAAILL